MPDQNLKKKKKKTLSTINLKCDAREIKLGIK